MRVASVLPSLLVCLTSILPAQSLDRLKVGDRFVGVWAGASVYSPAGAHLGATSDRHLFIAAFQPVYVIEARGKWALAYTADLVPLAIVSNNPTYETYCAGPDATTSQCLNARIETGRAPVFGAGLSPAGLKLSVDVSDATRLFMNASAGAIWFTREMPIADATRFNLAFDAGGGADIAIGGGRYLTVGYRFHHLSNAHPRNPGLDGNVLYLGILRKRTG